MSTIPKVSLDTTNALALSDSVSILPALRLVPQLEPFKPVATSLEAQAERAVITSEEAWQRGSEFLSVCTQYWDQLEDFRKAVKGPIDDYGKFIQSIFVPLQQRIKKARDSVNAKMLAFHVAEENRRKREAEEQRKRNEEAALKLAEQQAAAGDAAGADAILEVATALPVPQSAPRLGGTNTFGKSTGVTKRWVGTVAEPMEVLKAILAGHVPMSVIGEWSQSELNRIAGTLKVEKTLHGIRIEHKAGLQQR